MMCPNFLGVGNETGCKLSDLAVTGYSGNSAGAFVLKPLTATGTAESGPYYWVDIPVQNKKGWFLNMAGTSQIPGGAESVSIIAGRGLWCQGKGLKLVPAGEVNESLVAFTSNSGTGYTAMGNCTPVDLTLDKLTVSGYTGNSAGAFVLKLLSPTGTAESGPYYWVDIPAQSKCGWFLNMAGTSQIPGGASSVTITAGRGFWCQGKGLTLNIPAPVLN